MSTLHQPLQLEQSRDFVWTLDFDGENVSENSYACSVANLPIVDGGTVAASFTVDMADAATGFVRLTLDGASVTMAIDGYVWDVKETSPGPLTDTLIHGIVHVEKYVTA